MGFLEGMLKIALVCAVFYNQVQYVEGGTLEADCTLEAGELPNNCNAFKTDITSKLTTVCNTGLNDFGKTVPSCLDDEVVTGANPKPLYKQWGDCILKCEAPAAGSTQHAVLACVASYNNGGEEANCTGIALDKDAHKCYKECVDDPAKYTFSSTTDDKATAKLSAACTADSSVCPAFKTKLVNALTKENICGTSFEATCDGKTNFDTNKPAWLEMSTCLVECTVGTGTTEHTAMTTCIGNNPDNTGKGCAAVYNKDPSKNVQKSQDCFMDCVETPKASTAAPSSPDDDKTNPDSNKKASTTPPVITIASSTGLSFSTDNTHLLLANLAVMSLVASVNLILC